MGHSWKNVVHLEKWGPIGKMRHTWKNVAHWEKWDTFRKTGLHFDKWVAPGKEARSDLEKDYTLKKIKLVTFGKMGHT